MAPARRMICQLTSRASLVRPSLLPKTLMCYLPNVTALCISTTSRLWERLSDVAAAR